MKAQARVPEKVELSPNALRVLERRYLRKDERGRVVETPEEMFRRVAHNLAQADEFHEPAENVAAIEQDFYDMMARLEFLPNSPCLGNAGRELQQLAACFVLPVEDSLDSIFDAIKYTARIQQSGGGTGFSFSHLRPKGDVVKSTMGVSSGPVSFMKVFNAATSAIVQGGFRRGANMGILRVDHPDIAEFITCKEDETQVTNFNLSVGVTDAFMEAVKEDREYELVNPRTGKITGKRRAREVFDLMAQMAWKGGDPGCVFLDRINADNPTPTVGVLESTNPCGEVPLLPFEACNLGSINLAKCLKRTNGKVEIDWEKLKHLVRLAVHFLDNLIDMNRYPAEPIERITKANRKIGLGVMGWADLLIELGIPYDSEEALALADWLMAALYKEGRQESQVLAGRRGPFPNFSVSTFAEKGEPPLRNATVTTIAPTGTLSIIANCSSGIEPLFAIVYERHVLEKERLPEIHPRFIEAAKARGFYSETLLEKIQRNYGSVQNLPEVPEDVRRVFKTARDISPEWHIRAQAVFQRHTSNGVSKTVNFSNEAAVEDVKKAYWLAYELGCKGVTVFRDRSRKAQVLKVELPEEKEPRASGKCPDCGEILYPEARCLVCRACGYSKCGYELTR